MAVLLLKSRATESHDEYEAAICEALTSSGAPLPVVAFLPVLDFEFCGLGVLDDGFGGDPLAAVVCTSPRACEALVAWLKARSGMGPGPAKEVAEGRLPVFVAGRKSASVVTAAGAWVLGADAGSAEALVPVIAAHLGLAPAPGFEASGADASTAPADTGGAGGGGWVVGGARGGGGSGGGSSLGGSHGARPCPRVLHLCGNLRLDSLSKGLTSLGVAVSEVVVYRTLTGGAGITPRLLAAMGASSDGVCSPGGGSGGGCEGGSSSLSGTLSSSSSSSSGTTPGSGGGPVVVVLAFFSPSGVQAVLEEGPLRAALVPQPDPCPAVEPSQLAPPSRLPRHWDLRAVAIGATTGRALRERGVPLPGESIAATPTPSSLADAVKHAFGFT